MTLNQEFLRNSLDRCLSQFFSKTCRIATLHIRPFARQSSFAIKELSLLLEDGRKLNILWKRIGRIGLLDEAPEMRLQNPESPQCELKTYETLLKPGFGTPLCYGTIVHPETGEYWLFLEKVAGLQLNETGDLSIWKSAARWAANFHRNFSPSALDLSWLTKYDVQYYERWIVRAYEAVAGSDRNIRSQKLQCLERLLADRDRLAAQLVGQPQTLIHGEFYPANILIVPLPGGEARICPIDWGTTAIGPGLLDVAALVSGEWTETQRMEIAKVYRDSAFPELSVSEFVGRLNQCRMHIALKWIGWSRDWQPPREQAYDWLSEACRLAGSLEFK